MVLCLKTRESRTLPGYISKIMKIASSLKSLRNRDLNSKLVKRRGRVYIINKKIQSIKPDRNNMDDENHKKPGMVLPSLFCGEALLLLLS